MYKCPKTPCSGTTGVIRTEEETRLRKCHSCGCHFKTFESFSGFVEAPVKRSRSGKTQEDAPAFEMAAEIIWSGAE